MQMSNTPMSSGGGTSVFQDMLSAVTKPNEQTFAAMAASPNAKATTAYIWVAIASLIEFFLGIVVSPGLRNGMGRGIMGAVIGVVCGSPILAILATALFAAGVAIIRWLAGAFGGKATNDQLAYALAMINAPIAVVSGVFRLFYLIPYIQYCFGLLALLLFIYGLVLSIMAVKGVAQVSWGGAAGAVLIPFAVVLCVAAACAALAFFTFAASLSNIIRSANPGSTP
jgi:hypothetical protein